MSARRSKKMSLCGTLLKSFPELELKARISWIAVCLNKYLGDDYKSAVDNLISALPASNNPDLDDDDFGDFIYAPYAEYVAKFGCTEALLHQSFNALYEITQRFSAEDAIRYFLNAFPKETLKKLQSWTKDMHYHVRRLCSEGTRPKLPWSQKVNIPITAPLPLLDNLFFDKTRYVTRSVANHINDISKTDPTLALTTLRKWQETGKQKPAEMNYIVRHALRTLVKQGYPEAMNLLGFSHSPDVSVSKFVVSKQVKMDTALEFSFVIHSKKDVNVIIDYILYFRNKLGKLTSKKVFKLKVLSLSKNEPVFVSKRHMLRESMTTRTLYPGMHEVEIQVNGKCFGKSSFMLVCGRIG